MIQKFKQNPGGNCPMKTLLETRKCWLPAISLFSNNVFYPFRDKSHTNRNKQFVVCKLNPLLHRYAF